MVQSLYWLKKGVVMLVTLDIKNESMKDRFLNFISTLDYIDIKSESMNLDIPHDKSPKEDKIDQFAGMWKDRDITIKSIREEAWVK